jgi:hypothetical protein
MRISAAAEFRELAAPAQRTAAVRHEKTDHLTGHELSKRPPRCPSGTPPGVTGRKPEIAGRRAKARQAILIFRVAKANPGPPLKASRSRSRRTSPVRGNSPPTKCILGFKAGGCTPVDKAFAPRYVVITVKPISTNAFSPPEDALRKH